MKLTIKTALVALFALVTLSACAAGDKPIEVSQLPTEVQIILKTHFDKKTIAMAKVESGIAEKNYDVVFTDGTKIEFDRKGRWTEIDAQRDAVPTALLPEKIQQYVAATYSGQWVVKIERDRSEYEVELSGGLEITFNKHFAVIDID